MSESELGRLKRVELRNIWASEASEFTPWLARDENLKDLGDTLDIELELEAQEKSVGPFRADILCKDIGTGAWVLIENQLERTDHIHLGQILTYASGLEAVTIVWVAAQFREEHRSTLDWLNKITDDRFRFFGLEVELWKIGNSPAAPKFNVVSKPNDWSRSVSQAARAVDESELSETKMMQLSYWTDFNKVLKEIGGPVSGDCAPRPDSWMQYSIGRTDFLLVARMSRPKSLLMIGLLIRKIPAKNFFYLLRENQKQIEQEIDYSLSWEENATGTCRVCAYMENVDFDKREDWPRQHKWGAKKLNDLDGAFRNRVQSLDANDWSNDDEAD